MCVCVMRVCMWACRSLFLQASNKYLQLCARDFGDMGKNKAGSPLVMKEKHLGIMMKDKPLRLKSTRELWVVLSKMMCGIKQEDPSPCFCHILTGHISLSCLKGKIPAEKNEKKKRLS